MVRCSADQHLRTGDGEDSMSEEGADRPDADRSGDSRRWLVRRGLPLLALASLAALILYANWVGRAASVEDPVGDAVVVHAGERNRARHAFDLMDDGAAPTLVLMLGTERRSTRDLCGRVEPYEILCPTPEPATTIGEAIALGDLVEERSWTTVIAVTSDYHLRRATYLDRKCSGAEVLGSGAGRGVSRFALILRLAKEMAAMVQAALVRC